MVNEKGLTDKLNMLGYRVVQNTLDFIAAVNGRYGVCPVTVINKQSGRLTKTEYKGCLNYGGYLKLFNPGLDLTIYLWNNDGDTEFIKMYTDEYVFTHKNIIMFRKLDMLEIRSRKTKKILRYYVFLAFESISLIKKMVLTDLSKEIANRHLKESDKQVPSLCAIRHSDHEAVVTIIDDELNVYYKSNYFKILE